MEREAEGGEIGKGEGPSREPNASLFDVGRFW